MTLKQIQEMAKTLGIKSVYRHRKDVLIRIIQQAEGNAPCFKSIDECGESVCLWREGCQN